MLSEKEFALVYETLLSFPGMNEVIKMDVRIPRKNVLLLAKVIEIGLQVKKGDSLSELLEVAGGSVVDDLQRTVVDLLHKAGLSDMNEKLNALHVPVAGK